MHRQRTRRSRYARLFRYAYLRLVRVNATPERIGRGTALGIFLGVFPTFGLGPPLATLGAGMVGANRAAALLSSFACGPLTPFTWTAALFAGNALVAEEWRIARELIASGGKVEIMQRFFATFMIGNIAIGLALAIAGYFAAWWLAHRYRQRKFARAAVLQPRMNTDEAS
ncbi:MAG: DUF2062 domain-containing protein [Candidatus Acidiferrales bacterium]